MWVKYLWVCLVSGAAAAAMQETAPRPSSLQTWPLHWWYPNELALLQLQNDYEDSWKRKDDKGLNFNEEIKKRRDSLSVGDAIKVLRDRFEQRRKEEKIKANRDYLKSVGKRQPGFRAMNQEIKPFDYDNISGANLFSSF